MGNSPTMNNEPKLEAQGRVRSGRAWPGVGPFSPLIIVAGIVIPLVVIAAHQLPNRFWWKEFPWTPVAILLGAAGTITAAWITFAWQYDLRRMQEDQFRDKQKADQEHFESQSLDTQFKDIQDRFASENPIQRAHAANRLAEMAGKRSPGKPEEPTVENYPYFPRAVSHLVTALHIEEDRQNYLRKNTSSRLSVSPRSVVMMKQR